MTRIQLLFVVLFAVLLALTITASVMEKKDPKSKGWYHAKWPLIISLVGTVVYGAIALKPAPGRRGPTRY